MHHEVFRAGTDHGHGETVRAPSIDIENSRIMIIGAPKFISYSYRMFASLERYFFVPYSQRDANPAFYMCIGASDRIFDHFLSRSSAPTTLDNLVPIGSPFLLMRTQALSSNRIRVPSFRIPSFRARTTTACRMSPLLTLFAILRLDPPGVSGPKDFCFWTTTMILSPASRVRREVSRCLLIDGSPIVA
jgi:hypothetical protein